MGGSEKKTHGENMGAPASTKTKKQESLSGKTQLITVGFVLAIIGSLICGSYAKDTLTNYTGFGMLLAGIAIAVLGIFATAAKTLKIRLSQQQQAQIRFPKPRLMFAGVWFVGVGIVLTVIGYLVSNSFAEYIIVNDAGFLMLLVGACVSLVGISTTMLTTLKIRRAIPEKVGSDIVGKPRAQLGKLSIAMGILVIIAGSIVAGNYHKDTILNYVGFGTLLTGIAILSIGISKTVVSIFKNRLNLDAFTGEHEPRVVLGSIWAIGIGAMLVINGSLIASSYAKTTLMNYAGFGMLLAGTGVFVYGMFETARISAMGYLKSKRTHVSRGEKREPQKREAISKRLRMTGRNLVKTSAVLNLAGVMFALGLLFFSLWQLDIIVSGPVWHQNLDGSGWHAPNGAYANDYFQCFLWKTTIGEAYDTLFLLMFISFIVLFASAFFWPRLGTKKPDNQTN